MTGRFIAILAIIAALLAGVVYWLGRPSSGGPELEDVLPFPPGEVTELTIRWSVDGAAAARLGRAPDGTWVMRWRSGDSEGSWPVIGSRVSGAIGLLAKVRGSRSKFTGPLYYVKSQGEEN
ncbi:MAG TPA: hypothetical protein PKU91_11165, partial [Phycisphaerales bacterium]|nr:hypothetical protein [Phycisphaerales bacterium]